MNYNEVHSEQFDKDYLHRPQWMNHQDDRLAFNYQSWYSLQSELLNL